MSKEEICLACPSCKIFEIELKENKFYCEKCNLFYILKDGYPVLINFNLENVFIKEEEIKIEKEKLNKNKLKEKILNIFYGTSKVTKKNASTL